MRIDGNGPFVLVTTENDDFTVVSFDTREEAQDCAKQEESRWLLIEGKVVEEDR